MKKNTKLMYLVCRETLSEKINSGFIDRTYSSLDANFSDLETFIFLTLVVIKKDPFKKVKKKSLLESFFFIYYLEKVLC